MSGREEGQAVKENIIEQPELQMIRTERTSLVPAEKPRKQISRRDYQKALKRVWLIAELSLGANVIQAAVIWLLQAGPI